MKFTALEEYGLRCMLQLARKELEAKQKEGALLPLGPEAPEPLTSAFIARPVTSITMGEIAELEGLTREYAGKIFRILAKAKLVESERGRNGGYHLMRPPEQISVSETLAALGGRMFDRGLCERYTGDRRFCVHTPDCAIRSLWTEVQWMIDRLLVNTMLSDLISAETAARTKMRARSEELGLLTVGVLSKPKKEASLKEKDYQETP